MKPQAPVYTVPERTRRKLAQRYRLESENRRWKKAERAAFARLADSWARTLPKGKKENLKIS